MTDVTREGEGIIQRWKTAMIEKDSARARLSKCEVELDNAMEALKNWLVPKDYKVGEKFCVAYGKEFIQIEVTEYNTAEIKIRPRNKV